ncbi:methyl-accepting chemotaxis protein [Pseudomonas mangiferae]|uniref:Methyl-accepting chemotaxis protein n=2 Tax=Pseudomonas mangiferae TaxID=2593654 RepID=A0A553H4R1_9PSED|nr:methyl-accepting chemotaxis protein [Pseudomonas mangiferae]TRX76752.1 methyl-accepting chemotaxis protein [Pseudomonas mangiferae]
MYNSLKFSHKILLAASLVVTVAFACFVLFNDYRQRQSVRADVQSTLQSLGDLSSRNIQNWLEGRIHLLESIAQQVERQGENEVPTRAISLPVYGGSFQLSYFGGQDGSMVSVPAGNRAADYDPRTRGWYQAASGAHATVVTEPYIAASSGKLVITIATPVRAAGRMLGVAGADMDLEAITAIINSLDFAGHGHAFLVDANGKVLLHPDKDALLKPLAQLYPAGETPRIVQGVQEVQGAKGPEFVSFMPVRGVPSANWYVGLVLDQQQAYAMLSEFRTSAILATLIAVVATILLLGMLIRVLLRPLHQMSLAMEDIAQGDGDLTKRLDAEGKDEFGELAKAFNHFVGRIHASIREVSSTTAQVNEVAKLVLNASNSSMSNSDEQAQRTNSVAAAINELGAAAQEIARNAADASNQASEARVQSEDGSQVVERTIRAMSELSAKISGSCANIEALNSKTVNIGQILEVIKSISQQTNLLALNAAIEAARAGEAGRGFAVVADEVRNLAHRTQESAQEIQKMIEELQVGAGEAVTTMTESQRYSEESVEIANQAGERLSSVTHRIGEIDGMNQSVATATEEQTSVIETLNMDITEINTLNQEGVENLQATLRACADLERQAARLTVLVGSFRI